jgi:hypothetical protein
MTNKDILDLINPYNFVGTLPLEPNADDLPYFAQGLFPEKKRDVFKLEFLKGYKTGSKLAPLSTFDSNYSRKGRQGLKTVWTDLPFVRFAKGLTEEELTRFDTILALTARVGNAEAGKEIRDAFEQVFDDVPDLVRDVRSLRELTRFQVLTTNGVSIESTDYDGQSVNFDASFDIQGDTPWADDHVISITVPWENNAADPLADLLDFIKAARKLNRTIIRKLYLSSRLYEALLTNQNTRQQLSFGNGTTPNIVTVGQVSAWLQAHGVGNVEIIEPSNFNNLYTDYSGATQEFLEPTKIIGLPGNPVGSLVLAPTPVERARFRNPGTKFELTSDRIAIHPFVKEGEPITYDVIVSASFAPTGENMGSVFNLDVALP